MIVYAETFDKQHHVEVVGQSADMVIECKQFQQWLDNFDHKNMDLQLISIQSADIFGGGKVIFVKMETKVFDRQTQKPIPGIVFLRGNAVAILCLVVCKETREIYILLTTQPRVALGCYNFTETVAGMIDKNDGVIGRTIAEMKEETSITINQAELQFLGEWAPSAGGCDEKLISFLVVKELCQNTINEILLKIHGAEDENEYINIKMYTLSDFVDYLKENLNQNSASVGDAKILSTITMLMVRDNPIAILELLKTAVEKSLT